ncbi:MAG: type VII toxin-antitoxin system MntA family adenylyltransferase antitoxin [bacterium]
MIYASFEKFDFQEGHRCVFSFSPQKVYIINFQFSGRTLSFHPGHEVAQYVKSIYPYTSNKIHPSTIKLIFRSQELKFLLMDIEALKSKLKPIFEKYKEIKLVYLFGSRARGLIGPLSDYDFAVYLEEMDKKKIFDIKLELITSISEVLRTDEVDVVILNEVDYPELKYNIIKEGKLLFEREAFKVLVEPRILTEYFDFHSILKRHKLTKG